MPVCVKIRNLTGAKVGEKRIRRRILVLDAERWFRSGDKYLIVAILNRLLGTNHDFIAPSIIANRKMSGVQVVDIIFENTCNPLFLSVSVEYTGK